MLGHWWFDDVVWGRDELCQVFHLPPQRFLSLEIMIHSSWGSSSSWALESCLWRSWDTFWAYIFLGSQRVFQVWNIGVIRKMEATILWPLILQLYKINPDQTWAQTSIITNLEFRPLLCFHACFLFAAKKQGIPSFGIQVKFLGHSFLNKFAWADTDFMNQNFMSRDFNLFFFLSCVRNFKMEFILQSNWRLQLRFSEGFLYWEWI